VSNHCKHSGFTLIEVLIAMVVLSVGLLGLAALQSKGMRFSHDSYLIAIATQQAEDMAERMRANPVETAKPDGTGGYDVISGLGSSTEDCETASCVSGERAEFDHAQWSSLNQTLFGAGDEGSITRNGDVFNITLNWSEVNDTGGTASRSYTMVFKP
jgi:type IV pilus assembly protein PilV